MSYRFTPLSARTLGVVTLAGAGLAVLLAVLLPSQGTAGTTTTGPPPPQCEGQDATLVILKPVSTPSLGTAGDDVIVGSAGNDAIRGLRGDDIVCGGLGDDHINGGKGEDDLNGEAGDDLLRGRPDADDLDGGDNVQTDRKRGLSGNDRCFGGQPTPDVKGDADLATRCESIGGVLD